MSPMADSARPARRIGDSERDLAVQYLQEHHAVGRLTAVEFDERMSLALQARTAPELVPLFEDLPEPRVDADPASSALVVRPAAPVATGPSPGLVTFGRVLAGLSWPAAIIGATLLGWGSFWWFVFIPIFVTPWLLGLFGLNEDGEPGGDDEDDDDDDEDDRPALGRRP
ncbi:protein of unknown function [Auraticoccus monumenti]|uniref:DUF1707 domain-containing protein n=2 Tax=Auraticoccus monumenti TaxID=675864 RepID=A0A1G6S429_9ACTN|nr:protein of unknown function [Auraticoccus monumenti]